MHTLFYSLSHSHIFASYMHKLFTHWHIHTHLNVLASSMRTLFYSLTFTHLCFLHAHTLLLTRTITHLGFLHFFKNKTLLHPTLTYLLAQGLAPGGLCLTISFYYSQTSKNRVSGKKKTCTQSFAHPYLHAHLGYVLICTDQLVHSFAH